MNRTKAREVVLQLLYQHDLNSAVARENVETFVHNRLGNKEAESFCLDLFDGVLKDRGDLDRKLESAATNWRLHRMTAIDRNILRLGAYELARGTEAAIVIDEAVKLAQRFGGANSGAFVNGVLDCVRKG